SEFKDLPIYRALSPAPRPAAPRYWNTARQRYCRRLTRYRNTLRSLLTRSPSQLPKPARKAGFSTFESYCGRETDCLLEGDGFELPVPEREDWVSSLGLLLARDRGVGADVSVQPGFVIIMPSPLEASGAPLCCSPVDPEDDERDQAPTIRATCRTEGCKYLEWTRAPRS